MKIFVWIFLLLVGLLGLLDLNLLCFHAWLARNKLTTYEYIINSRAAEQVSLIVFFYISILYFRKIGNTEFVLVSIITKLLQILLARMMYNK